jgi:hypothetical protein
MEVSGTKGDPFYAPGAQPSPAEQRNGLQLNGLIKFKVVTVQVGWSILLDKSFGIG